VIGASYTSVSFLKTFHPILAKHERLCISVFIIITTAIFVMIGKPRQLMVMAGLVNGLILPFALAILLIASNQKSLMNGYQHPKWMQVAGWLVVIVMGWMGYLTIANWLT
jgi:Mn2+/Fe2+ NRAMP family transporter